MGVSMIDATAAAARQPLKRTGVKVAIKVSELVRICMRRR